MPPKNNNGWKYVMPILVILGLMGTFIGLNASAISKLEGARVQELKDYVQKERYLTDMQCVREELAKIGAKLDTLIMRQAPGPSRDSDHPN